MLLTMVVLLQKQTLPITTQILTLTPSTQYSNTCDCKSFFTVMVRNHYPQPCLTHHQLQLPPHEKTFATHTTYTLILMAYESSALTNIWLYSTTFARS